MQIHVDLPSVLELVLHELEEARRTKFHVQVEVDGTHGQPTDWDGAPCGRQYRAQQELVNKLSTATRMRALEMRKKTRLITCRNERVDLAFKQLENTSMESTSPVFPEVR